MSCISWRAIIYWGEVGILILVDEEVIDAVLPELQYIGMLAEEDIDL